MKQLRYLLGFAALIVLFTFSNCGEDNPPQPTDAELRVEALTGTWEVTTVTLDGTDVTTDYDGMTLTFSSSKGYSVSGGDFSPIWQSSGTYDFKTAADGSEDISTLVRDDAVEMTVGNVSDANLSLSFDFAVSPPCRTKGVCGGYSFSFTKQP